MSAQLNSDGGLTYLEAKLGVFTHGPSQIRRNAALDILTGRIADTGVIHLGARSRVRDVVALTALTAGALPAVDWSTRLYASPWLAANHAPPVQFRIVRTAPPPTFVRVRWHLPTWALAVAAAGVLLGAGFELRTVTDRAQAVEPSTVLVAAETAPQAAAETAQPEVSPVEAPVVQLADISPPPPVTTSPTLVPAPPLPVPASEFGLLFDEGFTSNARQWPSDPQGTAWLGGGTYRLLGRQPTHFVAVGIPGTANLGDSVVTGWFRKVGGPTGGGYGLILRDQEPQARDGQNQFGHYYVFEAGDRGQIGLWLRDGDHWVDLLTWTTSDAVKPGTAGNELTVSAIGDHLSFLVNGVPVASQTDTLWHSGAAGVFVGGDGNEVALDRVAVRVAR